MVKKKGGKVGERKDDGKVGPQQPVKDKKSRSRTEWGKKKKTGSLKKGEVRGPAKG